MSMDEEKKDDVTQESSPEEVVEEEVSEEKPSVSEDEETPTNPEPPTSGERTVPYERFQEKINEFNKTKAELDRLKKQPPKTVNKALDVDDYIDISASLEGLDQGEKEFIAEQHKLSGKPLREIRDDENFKLWQKAYREKVEKERLTLEPSGKQTESDRPKTLDERLKAAGTDMKAKEKILTELGLYKEYRPKDDRVKIGEGR